MGSGELEGGLSPPPKFHISAQAEAAEQWRRYVPPEHAVEIIAPPNATEIATRTARRAASDKPRVPLLPPEYAARYKQRFMDRLWMRGLGAMLLLYIFGVLIYFAFAQFASFQVGGIESQISALGESYTNTLRLKERVKVLQDQMDLQFAALDCYKAIADKLPPELTLNTMNFDKGRKLQLAGIAPKDAVRPITDFNEEMRKVPVNNQHLFSKVSPPAINPNPRCQEVTCHFPCQRR